MHSKYSLWQNEIIMKTANKIFAGLALALVVTLTYKFTFTDTLNLNGTVLGEEDSLDSSLESLEKELDASLAELNTEIETEVETIGVEAEIETVENEDQIIAPTTENKHTTRKSSKIERLFFIIPVEIETEVVSDKGVVIKENKTLLGKILDIFSY